MELPSLYFYYQKAHFQLCWILRDKWRFRIHSCATYRSWKKWAIKYFQEDSHKLPQKWENCLLYWNCGDCFSFMLMVFLYKRGWCCKDSLVFPGIRRFTFSNLLKLRLMTDYLQTAKCEWFDMMNITSVLKHFISGQPVVSSGKWVTSNSMANWEEVLSIHE